MESEEHLHVNRKLNNSLPIKKGLQLGSVTLDIQYLSSSKTTQFNLKSAHQTEDYSKKNLLWLMVPFYGRHHR